MREHKVVVTLSAIGFLALFAGAGLILWHGIYRSIDNNGQVKGDSSIAAGNASTSASVGALPKTPTSSSGIAANPESTANSLGQLSPAQIPSSPSSSGQTFPQVDPTTFSQYDKYKSDKSALFADVKKGDGAELSINKKGAVYYVGWLTNGTEFDHSAVDAAGSAQDFEFTLGAHQVIPGWEEAMYGMKEGGVRLLIIPPAVGYGSTARGSIPANALLVFEVQLLSVK